MISLLLFADICCSLPYKILTPDNFDNIINVPIPTVVRYYTEHRKYSLVLEELISFVKKNVAMYEGAHFLPVSFTGSIAAQFEKILREATASQGYTVSEIQADPMAGLIRYHSHELAG